ncbi:hypothetical protein BTJ39_08980 [Izhakiella australiensis]|uniref:Fimbrial-type adhesion domain-containing protein n=1 Tax=Izhakiella australiensis TaxID=1926881 RepID=A0A1S8YMZ8_9GAMM|nr:fimbria assembly protein [Izhakiella australiensis]OON40529.1 hypothetical protein BTJ39_08980 [Izhakiella australiensis]
MNPVAKYTLIPGLLITSWAFAGSNSVGLQNLQLTGNIVELSCQISAGDSNKVVDLGRWATRGLRQAGSATSPVSFSFQLTGCPPGIIAITFSGKTLAGNSALLALDDSANADNVAVELSDQYHRPLSFGQPADKVSIDASGNASLLFFARYVALNNHVQPGPASASAEFRINYY